MAEPPVSPARWSDETIPTSVSSAWSMVIRSLLDLSHDAASPRVLVLTTAARDLFIGFHDENGRAGHRATEDGDHDLAAALSKLRATAARVALMFELASAADRGVAELVNEVSTESMKSAIDVVRWFEFEARRAYGRSASSIPKAEQDLDARVLEALSAGPMSRNELRDHFNRNVPSGQLTASLHRLRTAGLASQHKEPTGGRPREVWESVSQ